MRCYCRHKIIANNILVFQENELLKSKKHYLEVICPPKICIKQRIENINNDKKKVRVIIYIYNYEKEKINNLEIINEIEPIPKEFIMNESPSNWQYSNGNLNIKFNGIGVLSPVKIIYTLEYSNIEEVKSIVKLKDHSVKNGKLKKCKDSLKL